MVVGGEREAFLTADYNAEMIEQIARFPWVRDRAIFVGEPADVVPGRFGPGLPDIREWTSEHFEFSGYITGFDPAAFGAREELRARLGYAPDERVCVVTVGGSGVGAALLERAIEATRRIPDLRTVVVAGPRIDPATLPASVEVWPYVPDLHMHLAACDVAIVQGGLTTAMELTAAGRPFIYVPLERHCEQNLHVAHRLERHRAGRRMRFDEATPDALAAAIAEEIGREVDYLPVPAGGAARAAALIAELITPSG
jgi:UDP:flavonoid glycosyltransferase YjiC (YdhE family)